MHPSSRAARPTLIFAAGFLALSCQAFAIPARADSPGKTRLEAARVDAARAQLAAAEARLERARQLVTSGYAATAVVDQARLEVARARAEFLRAEGKAEASRADVDVARVALDAAAARLERMRQLRQRNLVSEVELVQAEADLARAKADLEVAQAAVAAPPAAPAATRTGERPASARELIQERLELARQQYELLLQRRGVGRDVEEEEFYRWSRRWMEAELELARKKSGRIAAARAHLDRMRDLESLALARVQAGIATPSEAAEAQYHRLEAEQKLRELQGR